MIWFFTPYSFEKRLFDGWDNYMNLVTDPEDWVCMKDGDIMFLLSDFGHQMQQYIDAFPDTGMFTCYASRAHWNVFMRKGVNANDPSILYHHTQAENIKKQFHLQVKNIEGGALGHLLLMKKATWLKIRDRVAKLCSDQKILGVDVRISKAVYEADMKILLMRGIYVLHFFRMKYGKYKRDILL
jgi:hypothetical protein